MAELIAVVGESGSGKTTSLRNLDPKEVFIISTTGKRPGVRGAINKYPSFTVKEGVIQGNFYVTSNIDQIDKMLQVIDKKMPQIKVLVIDDYQYLQGFEAMNRVDEKGYGKFTDIAKHAYQVMSYGMKMRDDLTFVVMTHSENTGDVLNPRFKMKTLGKMLDSVITLEGLFTYVFFTSVTKDENNKVHYNFITNSDGTTTAKNPIGLFDEMLIDNDLDYVIKKIHEFNGSSNELNNESNEGNI